MEYHYTVEHSSRATASTSSIEETNRTLILFFTYSGVICTSRSFSFGIRTSLQPASIAAWSFGRTPLRGGCNALQGNYETSRPPKFSSKQRSLLSCSKGWATGRSARPPPAWAEPKVILAGQVPLGVRDHRQADWGAADLGDRMFGLAMDAF
jgi:hypothetical protein